MTTTAPARASGAIVDLKVGQTFTLKTGGVDSQEITLTLLHKHGQLARVQVQAPEAVKIRWPAKRP